MLYSKRLILCLSLLFFGWISNVYSQPQINGPRLFGARVEKIFVYPFPILANGRFTVWADKLPKGVELNKQTGVLTGKVKRPGEYTFTVHVKDREGVTAREFTLVVGERLALTPPMGWSSWYSYGRNVTQEKIALSARLLKEKGLQQRGWTLIAIDDPWSRQPDVEDTVWNQLKNREKPIYTYWEGPDNLPGRQGGTRDQNGKLIPNSFFPDLKGLLANLHQAGFKVGIYSSPGPITCAGASGSMGHEFQDAKYWADLGFDYLKYDWCSYGAYAKDSSTEEHIKPYRLMSDALLAQDRDIIHAICQYGMDDVWEWGDLAGGQLWRTGHDIRDNWASVYGAMRSLADKTNYVKPGNWNDPDILQIGTIGGNDGTGKRRQNKLTKEEQRTHFSMWCMLSAPLLIGANLEDMDDFTIGLLTNNEIIALDQDALGKAASLKQTFDNGIEIWKKTLEDGSEAVAILNTTERQMEVSLESLHLTGAKGIRDLWQHQDVALDAVNLVPAHGTWVLKICY